MTILRINSIYFPKVRLPLRAVRLGAFPSVPISAVSRGSFYVLHANWSLPASNAPSQTFPWERSTVLPFSRRDVFLNLPPFTLQPLLSPVYLDVSAVMTGFRVRSAFRVFSLFRSKVSRGQAHRRLAMKNISFLSFLTCLGGVWWRSWLRHCATSHPVAGSISDGVIGIILPAAPCPWG